MITTNIPTASSDTSRSVLVPRSLLVEPLSPGAFAAWLALAQAGTDLTVVELAQLTGRSVKHVSRMTAQLVERKLLRKQPLGRDGVHYELRSSADFVDIPTQCVEAAADLSLALQRHYLRWVAAMHGAGWTALSIAEFADTWVISQHTSRAGRSSLKRRGLLEVIEYSGLGVVTALPGRMPPLGATPFADLTSRPPRPLRPRQPRAIGTF